MTLLTRQGRTVPAPARMGKRKEAGAIAAARVAKTGARADSRKAARVQEALVRHEPPEHRVHRTAES
jgi:hypothetical protein